MAKQQVEALELKFNEWKIQQIEEQNRMRTDHNQLKEMLEMNHTQIRENQSQLWSRLDCDRDRADSTVAAAMATIQSHLSQLISSQSGSPVVKSKEKMVDTGGLVLSPKSPVKISSDWSKSNVEQRFQEEHPDEISGDVSGGEEIDATNDVFDEVPDNVGVTSPSTFIKNFMPSIDFVIGDDFGGHEVDSWLKFRVVSEFGPEFLLEKFVQWSAYHLFDQMPQGAVLVPACTVMTSPTPERPQLVGNIRPPMKPPWNKRMKVALEMFDEMPTSNQICSCVYHGMLVVVGHEARNEYAARKCAK